MNMRVNSNTSMASEGEREGEDGSESEKENVQLSFTGPGVSRSPTRSSKFGPVLNRLVCKCHLFRPCASFNSVARLILGRASGCSSDGEVFARMQLHESVQQQ